MLTFTSVGADLYLVIFNALLEGKDLPNGREGFYFAETSELSSYENSKIIAEALKELGKLATDQPTPSTAKENASSFVSQIYYTFFFLLGLPTRSCVVVYLGRKLPLPRRAVALCGLEAKVWRSRSREIYEGGRC